MKLNTEPSGTDDGFGSVQFQGLMTGMELAGVFADIAQHGTAASAPDAEFATTRAREVLDLIDDCLAHPGEMTAAQVEVLEQRRSLLRTLMGSLSR